MTPIRVRLERSADNTLPRQVVENFPLETSFDIGLLRTPLRDYESVVVRGNKITFRFDNGHAVYVITGLNEQCDTLMLWRLEATLNGEVVHGT